eukprot:TRINITY_DN85968_c1_g1_i1.p1 TRINITY_DN85968_c1_g1~~TRINITY_DN85968_c1_g1_i1.p1  ORF type:complete len:126 (+),score=4.19 TRINITY_DN85968_c1_g1_i1:101-478(+)
MRSIESTLALWVSGYLTSAQVVEWATEEIEKLDNPTPELLDLVTDGPERCLKRPAYDFRARPDNLNYLQQFALRAMRTRLDSDASVLKFAEWAAINCIGEDLVLPMVSFGYQVIKEMTTVITRPR